MSLTLRNSDCAVRNLIDKTVCAVNAPTPVSSIVFFQWLGLPYAAIAVAVNIFEKLIDTPAGFLVLLLPRQIVIPRLVIPCF
jgi:hypothetical protein